MTWQKNEIEKLKQLASEKGLFYSEIAELIGKTEGTTRWMARKLGLPGSPGQHRFATWNIKHAHLREEALKYFLDHSFEETAEHFALTHSELKSLLTVAYTMPEFRHLRKDTRTHNKWTVDELLFLLRHSGFQSREWIAEKINRGSARVIKERLMSMGINSKTLNGMTLSKYVQLFGKRPDFTVDGHAGPGRSGLPTYFKIVPWVEVERALLVSPLAGVDLFVSVIVLMANFQRWIHGDDVLRSVQMARDGEHRPPESQRTYTHHEGHTRKPKRDQV